MKTKLLTFKISTVIGNRYSLASDPTYELPFFAWESVSAAIQQEPDLFNCSATTLKTRWEQGMASCAIYKGEIVSYTSRIPFFTAEQRKQLALITNRSEFDFPKINVFQGVTGWTRADWRKQGICSLLNKYLYQYKKEPSMVHVSYCLGLSASPLFHKLRWYLTNWSQLPFVTSLGAWFERKGIYVLHENSTISTACTPYKGRHLSWSEFPDHPWSQHCHFWVEDIQEALRLEHRLSTLFKADIEEWRSALRETSAPSLAVNEVS